MTCSHQARTKANQHETKPKAKETRTKPYPSHGGKYGWILLFSLCSLRVSETSTRTKANQSNPKQTRFPNKSKHQGTHSQTKANQIKPKRNQTQTKANRSKQNRSPFFCFVCGAALRKHLFTKTCMTYTYIKLPPWLPAGAAKK